MSYFTSFLFYSENFQVEESLPHPGSEIFCVDVFTLFGRACLTLMERFDTFYFQMRLGKFGGKLYLYQVFVTSMFSSIVLTLLILQFQCIS